MFEKHKIMKVVVNMKITGLYENLQVNMGNINPVLTNQIAGFWATSN